ncbi:MAG: hypothetical protein V1663_05810 [archaeon]
MKSETLIYGMEILVMLDKFSKELSFKELEEKCNKKGDELRELLKYLAKKEYIIWKNPLFINEHWIDDDKIKLEPKGMEVVLGKRDYFNEIGEIKQTIHNQTNVNDSSNFQVAQTTGSDSLIIQTQDNSKINILKQLIENDKELDEPKKKKLFGILEKFNTLKESGENAYDLINQVKEITIKYVPLFFSLFNNQ